MTDYVLAEFTSQFARLKEFIDRDDVDKLKVFLQEERFILLVDEQQMQNLKDTTMNAELRGREKVIPVLVNDVFEPQTPEDERVLVKYLAIDHKSDPSVFIQKEVFVIRCQNGFRRRWGEGYNEERVIYDGTILNIHYKRDNWKYMKYLTESPQSWNVDLPDCRGWSTMQINLYRDDYRTAVQLAKFSNEVRPYPITFRFAPEVTQIRVPLEYLLWPQELRLIQPERMQPQFKKLDKKAKSLIPTRDYGYEFEPMYHEYTHFGLMYELLLANAELANYDMTGDGRLPYDDITAMDSTRMWPIVPVGVDHIVDHSKCESFLDCSGPEWKWGQFLEEKLFRKHLFNTWKEHRFNNASPESGAASRGSFRWGPPSLKDFVRLVIRRCMVRRVEPTAFDWEETTQPNQAKLVQHLQLPEHLRDFMLFMDVSIKMRTQAVPSRYWKSVITAKYGTGFNVDAVNGGFIPESALSLHRSGIPNGITVHAIQHSTWRIDPLAHDGGN